MILIMYISYFIFRILLSIVAGQLVLSLALCKIGPPNRFGFSYFNTLLVSNLNHRWYASWILLGAYLPIALLYVVWIPLTVSGRITATSSSAVLPTAADGAGATTGIGNTPTAITSCSSTLGSDKQLSNISVDTSSDRDDRSSGNERSNPLHA
jgi:hypothetical protein